jgi:hypothetical protein
MAVYAGFLMFMVAAWVFLRGRDLRIKLGSWVPFFRRRRERKQEQRGDLGTGEKTNG